MESGLAMTSANSLRTLGCTSSGPIVMHIQVPQLVTNLVFTYSGRGFSPLVPILQSIGWGGARREVASEDWGKRVVEYLSLLLVCWYEVAILVHRGDGGRGDRHDTNYAFFNLPFLADMPTEVHVVILRIPRQVQLQLCLGPPDLIPTQLGSIPILFVRYLSLLPLPVQNEGF